MSQGLSAIAKFLLSAKFLLAATGLSLVWWAAQYGQRFLIVEWASLLAWVIPATILVYKSSMKVLPKVTAPLIAIAFAYWMVNSFKPVSSAEPKPTQPPYALELPFYAPVYPTAPGMKDGGLSIWLVDSVKGEQLGQDRYFADLFTGMRITNLQEFPATIDAVSIEIEESGGKWVRLTRLPVVGYRVFMEQLGISRAREIVPDGGVTQFLDVELWDRPLAPRASVSGLAFFELPHKVVPSTSNASLRVFVRDMAGVEFTSPTLTGPTVKSRARDGLIAPWTNLRFGGVYDLSGKTQRRATKE